MADGKFEEIADTFAYINDQMEVRLTFARQLPSLQYAYGAATSNGPITKQIRHPRTSDCRKLARVFMHANC